MVSVVELDIGFTFCFYLLFLCSYSWWERQFYVALPFGLQQDQSCRTTTFCSCALERSNFTLIGI
jgi:hypothetical protein